MLYFTVLNLPKGVLPLSKKHLFLSFIAIILLFGTIAGCTNIEIKNPENYDGYVYNITVENNHTYTINNIVTHNCAPYDHDDSFTNSLGSTFIFKRIKAGEAW